MEIQQQSKIFSLLYECLFRSKIAKFSIKVYCADGEIETDADLIYCSLPFFVCKRSLREATETSNMKESIENETS